MYPNENITFSDSPIPKVKLKQERKYTEQPKKSRRSINDSYAYRYSKESKSPGDTIPNNKQKSIQKSTYKSEDKVGLKRKWWQIWK